MDQGQVLPLPHTVNDLDTEAVIAAPGKVSAQLRAAVLNLLSVSSMTNVHAVYRLASVLHVTPVACYEIYTVLGLACEGMADFIAKSCIVALKIFSFLEFWA